MSTRPSKHQPWWPDLCQHMARGGEFVGSTVSGEELWDVYVFPNPEWPRSSDKREVCIRYGKANGEYISCYGPPEYICSDHGHAQAYGPAVDLLKAFLARERGQ